MTSRGFLSNNEISQNEIRLTNNISLVKGNIFLTPMKTITVTVNCVGVMGKGIALSAKNLFPKLEEFYKKLCYDKEMIMGRPILYKEKNRETYVSKNNYKSILLFPTKTHYRYDSPIEGIKIGLKWLVDNYEEQEITSLAIPALGCGNGGLKWKDVGPILFEHLNKMKIRIQIYYPEEIDNIEHLTFQYLKKKKSTLLDYK